MVDPKKQDFWPKINILKGNHCILRIRGAPVCQKLGMILGNKVVQKLKLEKNVFYKKWPPKLIFLNFSFFWKNSVDFWHRKLTLKVWFWHFLTNWCSPYSQNTTVSFEHVDVSAKSLHFRTHHLLNSTTELILISTIQMVDLIKFFLQNKYLYMVWL